MYCVGLTGNIASGKSTAASFFKNRGITVISADAVSRELTQANQPTCLRIQNHFGKSILNTSGELDRTKLRQIIFSDPNERLWLERLLHPLIRERIMQLLNSSQSPYSIVEIPLLTDRETYPYLNRVLVILADPQEQIRRVMDRDKCSREEAQAILATQPDILKRQRIADDIVLNNNSLTDLEKNIARMHEKYLRLAELERSKKL